MKIEAGLHEPRNAGWRLETVKMDFSPEHPERHAAQQHLKDGLVRPVESDFGPQNCKIVIVLF